MADQARHTYSYFGEASDYSPVEYWHELKKRFSKEFTFPKTFLTIDIETTGVSPANSNILQVGFAQYIDGKLNNSGGVFIATPEDVLNAYDTGEYVTKRKADGNTGYVKSADVRERGIPACDVFAVLGELHNVTVNDLNGVVVGHNLCRFDVPFIEHHSGIAGCPIKFNHDKIFDTGAMFKASRLNALPARDQNMWHFFCAILARRAAGVYWNLAEAARTLGVASEEDIKNAHDAQADCLMSSKIYLAMCNMA